MALARASEWWEYKLLPALGVGYATCLMAGASPWDGIAALAWLIAALVPGAIFVSVLNDLTDRADDAAAGKPNRLSGASPVAAPILIAACLMCGAAFGWLWRDSISLLVVYAAGWIAFTLYSVPPFRLKRRGIAGIVCDAVGANVVPAVLAALLCLRTLAVGVPPLWLAAVAVWALAYGLRGILWHQIGDLVADQRSGTQTFVARHGATRVMALTRWVLFPIEVLALLVLIIGSGQAVIGAAIGAAALYAFLIHERVDRFGMAITVVKPRPRSTILLHEYYDVFLPIALLLTGATRASPTLIVLAVHFIAFPVRIGQVLRDFRNLLDPQYKRRTK